MKVIETDGFKEDMRRLFSDEPKYVLRRWWGFISRGMLDEIKWFVQRGIRGYSDRDGWDLDGYLVSWLPKALRELKRSAHGYPNVTNEVNTIKKWKAILEKMARGFEAKEKQNDLMYTKTYLKKRDGLQKEFEEGMKLFVKYFDNLWD